MMTDINNDDRIVQAPFADCLQSETAAELDALLPAILDRPFKDEL